MADVSLRRYELFLSYADADRAWVEGFLIPELGLPADKVVTRASFRLGESPVEEIERALQDSRFAAIVVSGALFDETWPTLEERLASFASATKSTRLVSVLLDRDAAPPRLLYRLGIDCHDPRRWSEEVGRLRALLNVPEPPAEDLANPYPGLVPFTTAQSGFYFGREDEVAEVVLRLQTQRFLCVIAASGSGKSSLIAAGVIPSLAGWSIAEVTPGSTPIDTLRTARARLAQRSPALLVVDQFEQIFARHNAADEQTYLDEILDIRATTEVRLLLAISSEFYTELIASRLWPLATGERVEVAPLRGERLRPIVVRPSETVGVRVQPELLEKLLADAGDEPGALPFVQATMSLLWAHRERRLLTRRAYDALARDGQTGLAMAIALSADAVLSALGLDQRRLARRILLRLVQFGSGRPDTRRQDVLGDLAPDPASDEVVAALVRGRLLTLTGEKDDATRRVDMAHDLLIVAWPEMRQWIAIFGHAERQRRQFEARATEWDRRGRRGGLLDDVEWREVVAWMDGTAGKELGASAVLQELVASSRTHGRKAKVGTRILMGAAGVLTIGLLAIGWWTLHERARQQRMTLAQALAAEARAQLTAAHVTDERAALLAVQAYRFEREVQPYTSPAVDAALRMVADVESFASLAAEEMESCLPVGKLARWDREHEAIVVSALDGSNSATFPLPSAMEGGYVHVSPDCESWLVDRYEAGGLDVGSLRRPTRLVRLDGRKVSTSFSKDGGRLAAWGDDAELRIWDLRQLSPTEIVRMPLPDTATGRDDADQKRRYRWDVALADTGSRFLVTESDRKVHRCEAASRSCEVLVTAAPKTSATAALSRDGQLIAVAASNRVRLANDTTTLFETAELDRVTDFQFGPGETTLYWRLAGPRFKRVDLRTKTVTMFGVSGTSGGELALDASGTRVFTWDDPNPIVWHVGGARLSRSLSPPLAESPEYGSPAIALDPNGRDVWFNSGARVETVNPDDNTPARPVNGSQPYPSVVVRCGARVLMWGGGEETTWGSDGLPEGVRASDTAACTRDGGLLVTGEFDVEIWDLENRAEKPVTLPSPLNPRRAVWSLGITQSRRWLAVGFDDGSAYLWDRQKPTAAPARVFKSNWGARVAFSPDDKWLATTGGDGLIRLHEVGAVPRDSNPEIVLSGNDRQVYSLAFSDDGSRLASGGADGTVRVWRLDDPAAPPLVLRGHGNYVMRVMFHQDGRRLVSQDGDYEVRIWTLDPDDLVKALCTMVLRNLSGDEWRQFIGADIPPQRTCEQWPPPVSVR